MAISSANANKISTLNGLFKEIYGDSVENLIPDQVKMLKAVPFVARDKMLGANYHQPVIVAQEHGFSYGGTDGSAFDLNDPVAGQVKDASIISYEFVLRTAVGAGSIMRSMNDKGAFERATKLIVANMVLSFSKRLEAVMLYGKRNVGVLGTPASVSSGVYDLPITAASWAPALWAGGKNMKLYVYNAAGTTLRGTAGSTAVLTVSQVDIVNKTIRVTGDNTILGTLVATDIIKHAYSGTSSQQGTLEFDGLEQICRNTGTLFNIDAAQYDLWQSTVYSAGSAQLTQSKINKALALAVAKGLEEDVECHVNPSVWENLLQAQDALRMYDSSYKSDLHKTGAKAIEFYGQNGKISVVPNPYVKESLAFIFPEDVLLRVGSSEVTFKRPGTNEEFFRDLENNSGVELRAYADMALFCHAPSRLVLIENIVVA